MTTNARRTPVSQPPPSSEPFCESPESVGDMYALSERAKRSEGQPISDLMARALANPNLISLAAGFVDQQTLPVKETKKAIAEIFQEEREAKCALQYGSTAGSEELRSEILTYMHRADKLSPEETGLSIDQMVLTAGSNQLLHLVAESLLDPGDIVLCASPTYFVFMGVVQAIGGRSYGVPTDDDGIVPEGLDEALRRIDAAGELSRVKAVYVVPYFDNPRGVTTSLKRRQQMMEVVRRWSRRQQMHVISDDAYRELRYFGEDVPSVYAVAEPDDLLVCAGTFSKAFSPGVRVGWGTMPDELLRAVCNQKGNLDFGSPHFSQQVMAKVLSMGLLDEHVQTLRTAYRQKLEAMLDAADEHLRPIADVHWSPPLGGLYVWVTLPESVSTAIGDPLFETAVDQGVLYVPGHYCYPTEGEPICRSAMRLSFGVQTPEKIREGMEALSRAIRKVL